MADRDYEIKIRTTADTAGAKQTEAELEKLQAKAATPAGTGFAKPGQVAPTAAAAGAGLEAAEKEAAIQSQLQTIAQTRLDLATATIAGDEARAEILANELRIRTAVLGVMRTETLTQAELNALCEQEGVALAAVNAESKAGAISIALAGANLNKAKGEATVLAREIATGSFNARTLGSLLGSLGIPITIGTIAGLGLASVINKIGEEIKKAAEQQLKLSREIDKSVQSYKDISSVEEWGNKAEAIESKIVDLRDKRLTASESEKASLDGQIGALERQLTDLDLLAKKGLERKAADEQARLEIGEEIEAMRQRREEAAKTDPSIEGRAKAREEAKRLAATEEKRVEVLLKQKAADQERIENARRLRILADDAVTKAKEEQKGLEAIAASESGGLEKIQEKVEATKEAADAAEAAASQAESDARQATRDQEGINAQLIKRRAILEELRAESRKAAQELREATAAQFRQTTENLFKGPAEFQTEQENERRQQAARVASAKQALKELESIGGARTEEEKEREAQAKRTLETDKRFGAEQEKEALRRKLALQESLIPEGGERNLPKYLGTQGEKEFRAMQERLRQLDEQERGRTQPPPSAPAPQAATAPAAEAPGKIAADQLKAVADVFEKGWQSVISELRGLKALWQ